MRVRAVQGAVFGVQNLYAQSARPRLSVRAAHRSQVERACGAQVSGFEGARSNFSSHSQQNARQQVLKKILTMDACSVDSTLNKFPIAEPITEDKIQNGLFRGPGPHQLKASVQSTQTA